MDCGACAATIEKHLSTNAAIKDVRVNFSTGKMQIVHETSNEEIMKEVSRAGFTASPITKGGAAPTEKEKRNSVNRHLGDIFSDWVYRVLYRA